MHRQIAQFSSSPVTVSLCITRESTLLRESKGPLGLVLDRFLHYPEVWALQSHENPKLNAFTFMEMFPSETGKWNF